MPLGLLLASPWILIPIFAGLAAAAPRPVVEIVEEKDDQAVVKVQIKDLRQTEPSHYMGARFYSMLGAVYIRGEFIQPQESDHVFLQGRWHGKLTGQEEYTHYLTNIRTVELVDGHWKRVIDGEAVEIGIDSPKKPEKSPPKRKPYELHPVAGVNAMYMTSRIKGEGRFRNLRGEVFRKSVVNDVINAGENREEVLADLYELRHTAEYWGRRVDWHSIYFQVPIGVGEYSEDHPAFGNAFVPPPTEYNTQGILIYKGKDDLRTEKEIFNGSPEVYEPAVIKDIFVDVSLPKKRQELIITELIKHFISREAAHGSYLSAEVPLNSSTEKVDPAFGKAGFRTMEDSGSASEYANLVLRVDSCPGSFSN